MKKFRLYYDTEKEIAWLNEMADEGWKLTGFFLGVYTFEPCEKGKYRYQVDTTNTLGKVSADYRAFMEDAGIEIVQVWGPWVILCKEAAGGKFEFFTDYESRLAHQKKMLKIFKICAIIELLCFYVEIAGAAHGSTAGIVGAILIGAILLIFCKTLFTIKNRIRNMKAEHGDLEGTSSGKNRFPLIILPGYALYLCSLLIEDDASQVLLRVKDVSLGAACLCMLIGIVLVVKRTREK